MELREYLQILRKRLLILIVIPVLFLTVAFILNYFVFEKVYEASTTIFAGKVYSTQKGAVQELDISNMTSDFTVLGPALVKQFKQLIKTNSVANAVKESFVSQNVTEKRMKQLLKLSSSALSGKVSVTQRVDSLFFDIKFSDTDPDACVKMADRFALVLKMKALDIMSVENVSIVDPAKKPTIPISPQKTFNILITLIVSILLSVGLIFLIEFLDNTVKTPEDVRKAANLNILGAIPEFSPDQDK